jgi:hypothetical protein
MSDSYKVVNDSFSFDINNLQLDANWSKPFACATQKSYNTIVSADFNQKKYTVNNNTIN